MSDVKSKFTLFTSHKQFIPQKTSIDMRALSEVDNLSMFLVGLVGLVPIGLTLLGLGLIAGLGFGRALLFTYDAQAVTGQVVTCDLKTSSQSTSLSSPRVTYTYEVVGKTYDGSVRPDGSCADFPVGAGVDVMYLRLDPRFSRVPAYDNGGSDPSFAGISCIAAGFFFWMIIGVVTELIKYVDALPIATRLRREGILLEGEIISIRGHRQPKGAYIVTVHYQFETPQHKLLHNSASAHRWDLEGKELPPVGSPIAVLYVDDQTYVML